MKLNDILEQISINGDFPIDLAEVALLLAAADEYEDLDVQAYISELNGMAREARAFVLGRTLSKRIDGLSRFLFHEMGFHGNTKDYYDPRNSYLNEVMDRRTGIPITLSILTMAIGKRVGLQIAGVGLPGHFIVRATSEAEEVLFDPFHGGRQLELADCENLVSHATGSPANFTPEHLRSISMLNVLGRLLNNLKSIYLRNEDLRRASLVLCHLGALFPEDPRHSRDLGMCCYKFGDYRSATEMLVTYLGLSKEGEDHEAICELLDQAMAEIALLN